MLWLGLFSYLNLEKASVSSKGLIETMLKSKAEEEFEIISYKNFLQNNEPEKSGFQDFKEYLPFNQ